MKDINKARELFSEARGRQEQGDLESARRLYLEALSLAPERPSLLVNLAAVLIAERKFAEAEQYCKRAIGIDRKNEVSWMNLGLSYWGRNQTDRALDCFDEALKLKQDYAEAYGNKGIALAAVHRVDEALECFDAALRLKPNYPSALLNRAELLLFKGRIEESRDTWNSLLSLAPDYRYGFGGLAFSKLMMCEWASYDETANKIVQRTLSGEPIALPFLAISVRDDPEFQRACAKQLSESKYSSAQPSSFGAYSIHGRRDHAKIRLAYLSSDFGNHSVSNLSAGLYELHDRSRFEVCGVHWGEDDSSEIRRRLEKAFDRFIDVRGKSTEEVLALMQQSQIDIAINLNGFTLGEWTEIFSSRSAPIQVNYLGYPGTMGAEYMDYILADRFAIPEDAQRHYAEKAVYLPDTFQVNDSKREIADGTRSRKEMGLPESSFVFCSFVNSYKINPTIFAVWMRLLQAVNGSVLWLAGWNSWVIKNLKSEAVKKGVAEDRLVFMPRQRYADYLALYRLADLSLDTLPFNGGTTSSDALWGGLPLVTCAGKSFAARMAGSLLMALGLPELITYSLEEYERLALSLALDTARLRDIRARLAANRLTHPLFDTVRFARNLEAAYEEMWKRFKRGEAPRSFSVKPAS